MDSNTKEQADLNSNGQNVVLMIDPNENDSMLSLKDLLYAVLRNLGIILIVAILAGGALFAYKITRQSTVSTSYSYDLSARYEDETDFEYEERLQKIDRARDIANAVTKVNSQIDHQRKYITDSVYMQIDAENVYETKCQFVISINENAAGGVDRALITAYQNAVMSGNYLDAYAKENGLKADYIKEVMYFDSQISDGAILSAEGSAGKVASFNVRVIGPSKEFTDDVIDLVKKKAFFEYDNLMLTLKAAEKEHPEWKVVPEIMIPLVGDVKELKYVKKTVVATADAEVAASGIDLKYEVGTMIEIPRACLTADEIAANADFFCFGTNDLTQMTFGFSRDDSGKFLNAYYDAKIFENDPFAKLDQEGVGKLMKMAIDLGKPVNPNLHIGICGEHGGDPSSVEFCHKIGLNYVSCSPFRVPVARLAAAQAAIADKK